MGIIHRPVIPDHLDQLTKQCMPIKKLKQDCGALVDDRVDWVLTSCAVLYEMTGDCGYASLHRCVAEEAFWHE